MMPDSLSKNLDQIMRSHSLSAMKLSSLIPVSSASIKKIRTGENKNPTIDVLGAIAGYFGLTLSQMVNEYDPAGAANVHNMPTNHVDKSKSVAPVLSWEEAVKWPVTKGISHVHNVITENVLSKDAFALPIETTEYEMFEKGSIILVDPKIEYSNHDYVLVHKNDQTKPNIRRILKEDDSWFLQSLIPGITNTIKLTDEYRVLGVVVASKKWFKKLR